SARLAHLPQSTGRTSTCRHARRHQHARKHPQNVGPPSEPDAKCCAPQLPRQFGEGEHVVFAYAIVSQTLERFLKRSAQSAASEVRRKASTVLAAIPASHGLCTPE